jgi:hypothetical protein
MLHKLQLIVTQIVFSFLFSRVEPFEERSGGWVGVGGVMILCTIDFKYLLVGH